jgi:hypothetical protein
MRMRGARDDATREAELLGPGLVHELRQPLMGIDAGLKLLARDVGAALTGLDAWDLVQSQLGRIQETLLSYGELMDGSRAEPRPFEVDDVVRRAADLVRFRTKRLGDRFALVFEPGVPVAFGTPGALLHAVTNLVVNADDAIAEAGGLGRLEVRAVRGSTGRPQVRVADEGVGIPPEAAARIFERGFTTKAEHKGTGLGLTIARRMLRACGGELSLASPDDPLRRAWARTELVIELPTAAADRVPLAQALRRIPRRAAIGVAAVVLTAGLALFFARRPAELEPAAPPPVIAAAYDASVAEVVGRLERRLATGGWTVVPEGSRLQADDTIRTGAGGRASLVIGTGSRLTVAGGTQLTVRELTAAAQRLRLTRGLVTVDAEQNGSRVLVIESEGGAVARAERARFTVLSTDTSMAIVTETGAVRLESAGASIDVPAGQQSVAVRGSAPRLLGPLSVALLLKVANAARPGAEVCAIVEGTVAPGSEVSVEGKPVVVGPEGRFVARVRRRPGAKDALVVTRDPAGRAAERKVPCVPPAAEHDVSDLTVRWQNANATP